MFPPHNPAHRIVNKETRLEGWMAVDSSLVPICKKFSEREIEPVPFSLRLSLVGGKRSFSGLKYQLGGRARLGLQSGEILSAVQRLLSPVYIDSLRFGDEYNFYLFDDDMYHMHLIRMTGNWVRDSVVIRLGPEDENAVTKPGACFLTRGDQVNSNILQIVKV